MRLGSLGWIWVGLLVHPGCGGGGSATPDPCAEAYRYTWRAFFPGPGEEGFDAELARIAERRDRQFHVFHTLGTGGVNTEIWIDPAKTAERQAIVDFLRDDVGWDFEAATGYRVEDVVDAWAKVAGMYAGAGIAADAFRYGTLRDQCYPAEEVDRARTQLLAGLDGLHRAVELTGIDGIARGFANVGFPGAGQENSTTPLADADGNPLPPEKSNGTWRADNSGELPDYIWEDSCSRDMLIGWAVGFGAAWEAIREDASVPGAVRDTLRADAAALLRNLAAVRASGYDLELMDADGRTTYHGYLNENNLERIYIDGVRNGFHTLMALGIVAALADIAGEARFDRYLASLVEEREFAQIAAEPMVLVNLEETTNFSNYNMAFDGAWLALRHLGDDGARARITTSLEVQLFDTPGKRFQPVEQAQAFYDLVLVAGRCGGSSERSCERPPDQALLDRALATLREFPEPPYFEFARTNCDQAEIASGSCTAEDGTQLTVLGEVGRNGDLLCAEPLPMRIRPPSNFAWRSNPYVPNGGSDSGWIYPGVDFRLVYWMGRWIRR